MLSRGYESQDGINFLISSAFQRLISFGVFSLTLLVSVLILQPIRYPEMRISTSLTQPKFPRALKPDGC
jgi:hypothetical protein